MTLLVIIIVLIALSAVGGGRHVYRRYTGEGGTTLVEEQVPGGGIGEVAGVLLGIMFLIGLLIYGSNSGWFH